MAGTKVWWRSGGGRSKTIRIGGMLVFCFTSHHSMGMLIAE